MLALDQLLKDEAVDVQGQNDDFVASIFRKLKLDEIPVHIR